MARLIIHGGLRMKKAFMVAALGIILGLFGAQALRPGYGRADHELVGTVAPEFTHEAANEWLNSPPLSLRELRGQVVLLDFWTFECWNCYRSFPWLKALQKRFADRPVRIIGVHSPEFERERDHRQVAAKMEEFGLDHPVMVDNDFSYWKAMHNRYWPAFYLIDKRGVVRHVYFGETHEGDSQARRIGTALARLAREPAAVELIGGGLTATRPIGGPTGPHRAGLHRTAIPEEAQ
jgi:thiol-disulfide isomerase/thioredoxin